MPTVIQPCPESSQTLLEETRREHLEKRRVNGGSTSMWKPTHRMLYTEFHQGGGIATSLSMFDTISFNPFLEFICSSVTVWLD
jgi:hypothetical protein